MGIWSRMSAVAITHQASPPCARRVSWSCQFQRRGDLWSTEGFGKSMITVAEANSRMASRELRWNASLCCQQLTGLRVGCWDL